MLDYDDLEALERYALAASSEERQRLLAVATTGTAVKPGQAFLAGLHALGSGDLDAAAQQVQNLRTGHPSDYASRLEALVALRSWKTDPKATCAYLENFLGLTLHATPPAAPAADSAESSGAQSGSAAQDSLAAAARQLPSVLDASFYAADAFLKQAVRQARGPSNTASGSSSWSHLSKAGKLAVLSRDEDLGLGLTPNERLQMVGAENGGSFGSDSELAEALAGNPFMEWLAGQALQFQKVSLFESTLPYLTFGQLENLASNPPTSAAALALPKVLAAAVRKLYGIQGLTPAAAAAAFDAPAAAAATGHSTPVLTAAEADAIRLRALDLCAKLKGDPTNVEPQWVAWIEARALLPLAEAAVQAAAYAAAAVEGAAGPAAVASKVSEAAELVANFLRSLAAQGRSDLRLISETLRSPAQSIPVPSEDLGPALPQLRDGAQAVIRLLGTLLHLSTDPPGLFEAGGALEGLLDKAVATRLVAEAMLTRGSVETAPAAAAGGMDWAAAYRDAGGDLAELAEDVELNLTGPERVGFGAWEAPDDDVALLLTHKAVNHISVLVYDIATEAYYKEKGAEVNMGIDLEGLGATYHFEIDLPYGLPSLQRCRRVIPLPQLKGRRGVWVVDIQGGGRHSRALVRRGGLAAVVRPSAAGLALTLFREDGSAVADPRVWLDGRLYRPAASTAAETAAEAAGAAQEVIVPYRASSAANVTVVLVDGEGEGGGFASLMTLNHPTEEYALRCAMHFEPESAAASGRGGIAPLLLQPSLTIGGWAAPLDLLQDVTLKVEVDDLETLAGTAVNSGSGSRQQVFQDWSPGDGLRASVVQIRLPDRPGRVKAVLTARVRRVAHGSDGEASYQDFCKEHTWTLNESDTDQDQLRDIYLTRGSDGGFLLRLLGRAGEPFPGVPVVVALTHLYSEASIPPSQSTLTAPPGAEPGSGADQQDGSAFGDDLPAAGGALVVRKALVTDANGCISLGHLYGITAVSAGIDATPATTNSTAPRFRRRYTWRLPAVLTGVPADTSAQAEYVLRGLESSKGAKQDGIPQFSIPIVAAPTEGSVDRLGLLLVSNAVTSLCGESAAQARGEAPPLQQAHQKMKQRRFGLEAVKRLDDHVTVRKGCIEVSGLTPGVYRLLAPALKLAVTLLVYRGPVVAPAPLLKAAEAAACPAAAAAPAQQEQPDHGFVLSGGLVAPLSEPKPLQVTGLQASADGGVTARLEGSPSQLAAAVVHVVLTRFEGPAVPHGSAEEPLVKGQLGVGAGTSFGVATAGKYQSGRRLGDEVRYVMERRRLVSEGRIRPMPALVDRPSLLLQPWKIRETETAIQKAMTGEGFAHMMRARPQAACTARRACYVTGGMGEEGELLDYDKVARCCYRSARGGPEISRCPMYAPVVSKDVGPLGLAFCLPAVVLPNVTVGPNGVVQLSSQQLAAAVAAAVAPAGLKLGPGDPWVAAGHRLVRVMAYTAPEGVPSGDFGCIHYAEARAEVSGAADPVWSDPRVLTAIQRPFPAGSASFERRSCHPLQPGSDLVIADAATAKLQLYGTVSKVWALYGSLLSLAPHSSWEPFCASEGAKLWAEFGAVSTWNKLASSAKVQRYSQLACRELAFFIYCHDRPFFDSVVLPYLRLRLPSSRCCLDSWLAGLRGRPLVEVWGAPHRYRYLTVLERILLAWEEDLLVTSGSVDASAAAAAPLPRLTRLAADMRARVRARAIGPGAAASVSDVNRRRFEIALNGPGQGDEDGGQGADLARAQDDAFLEVEQAPGGFEGFAGGLDGAVPMAAPAPLPFGGAAAPPIALFGLAANAAPPGPPAKVNRFAVRDKAARQAQEAAPAYRAPPATQEWAEAGWFRRAPTEALDPYEISPESEFWADLADHLARGGRLGGVVAAAAGGAAGPAFLPKRLESAGWSFSDALLATAAVGVEWEDRAPLSVAQGTQLTLTASAPSIAYVRQTAALPAAAGAAEGEASLPAPTAQQQKEVLLLQRLMDPNLDPRELPRKRARRDGEADAGASDGEDDADEDDNAPSTEGSEVPPGSPLVYGKLYCYTVTITNTGPSTLQLDVTVQAPQGAVALGGRPALWVATAELMPYGAHRLPSYYFYFPRPTGGASEGTEYDAYPAAVSVRGKIRAVAFGQPTKLKVLSALPATPVPDLQSGGISWARLAALPASPEADAARLRYLSEGDLASADLSLVRWRCRDAGFWRAAVAALRQRHVWDFNLWSYAVLHQDEGALRELLPASDMVTELLGPEAPAAGGLFNTAAAAAANSSSVSESDSNALLPDSLLDLLESADCPPHLEYWPLVNARAHPLGSKRVLLNDAVDKSWRRLLRRLAAFAAAGRTPGAEDLLAAAYYLALQDRPAEAAELVGRIDALAAAVATPDPNDPRVAAKANVDLQLCYLRAWLVLADPGSDAATLRASAEAVRKWLAADVATPAAVQVLEPKWQTRLAGMAAALQEGAAITAGSSSGSEDAMEVDPAAETREGGGDSSGGGSGVVPYKTGPVLLLYDSPEGPRGAVVLEAHGVEKVSLSAHQMDLELLFSSEPFESTLASSGAAKKTPSGADGATNGHDRFAILRPSWSTTLDLKAIAAAAGTDGRSENSAVRLLSASAPPTVAIASNSAPASSPAPAPIAYKLLLQPHQLVQTVGSDGTRNSSSFSSGALLLEAVAVGAATTGSTAAAEVAAAGPVADGNSGLAAVTRRVVLPCYRCGMRVVAQKERGTIVVTNADTGLPVGSVYVKAYVKYGNAEATPSFHKDGYTDRRGLLDYWTLTSKPVAKVALMALFVSHPNLGSTVLHVEPPLQG